MIATSSSVPIPFWLPWQLDGDGNPVEGAAKFLLRAGDVLARSSFEADLAGPPYHAGRVFPWDLADTAMAAARALLDGEALGQVLEALAALKASIGNPDGLDAAHRQLLIEIEPALCAAWPEYAELRRREARRSEMLPMLAAKRFLAGWEGREVPFEKAANGQISDAALGSLSLFELKVIGQRAYDLLYADVHRPLSVPPSKSGPGLPASDAGGATPMARAGKSTARSGKKIRS